MNMTTREELEQEAQRTISPELYWDLADAIEAMPDAQLRALIACGGDVNKELALAGMRPEATA